MSDRRLVVVVDAEPDTVMGLLASLPFEIHLSPVNI
jgi:hypothetical protein